MEKGTPSESEVAVGCEGYLLSMFILHVRHVDEMSRLLGKGQ